VVSLTKSRKYPHPENVATLFRGKVRNILLTDDYTCKVADFGFVPFNSTPMGVQSDFVWLSARTPQVAYVW